MIAYKEVLVLAIRKIESRLETIRKLCGNNTEMYDVVTKDLYLKWNDLTELYRIETGCEYEGEDDE